MDWLCDHTVLLPRLVFLKPLWSWFSFSCRWVGIWYCHWCFGLVASQVQWIQGFLACWCAGWCFPVPLFDMRKSGSVVVMFGVVVQIDSKWSIILLHCLLVYHRLLPISLRIEDLWLCWLYLLVEIVNLCQACKKIASKYVCFHQKC